MCRFAVLSEGMDISLTGLSDRERRVLYEFTTACRSFPLVRNGDTFSKASLSDMLVRHVWGEFQRKALANAEIVAIEGHAYPVHPDALFPVGTFLPGLTAYADSISWR